MFWLSHNRWARESSLLGLCWQHLWGTCCCQLLNLLVHHFYYSCERKEIKESGRHCSSNGYNQNQIRVTFTVFAFLSFSLLLRPTLLHCMLLLQCWLDFLYLLCQEINLPLEEVSSLIHSLPRSTALLLHCLQSNGFINKEYPASTLQLLMW